MEEKYTSNPTWVGYEQEDDDKWLYEYENEGCVEELSCRRGRADELVSGATTIIIRVSSIRRYVLTQTKQTDNKQLPRINVV